jgi:hypothetical protein
MNWKPGFKSLLFHIQLVPLHGGELRNLCVQQRAEEARVKAARREERWQQALWPRGT